MAVVDGAIPVLLNIGHVSADSLKLPEVGRALCPPANKIVDNSPSSESTSTRQDAGESWTLVWCCERCCKKDQDETRKGLAAAARKAGGKLLCVRKAHKFAAWFSTKRRAPFVLLVDWREVKPCIEFLDTTKEFVNIDNSMPAVIVVLAETAAIFKRASTWAKTRSAKDRPVIVQDFSDVHTLMDGIAKHTQLDAGVSSWLDKGSVEHLGMGQQLVACMVVVASTSFGTPIAIASSPQCANTSWSPGFLEVRERANEEAAQGSSHLNVHHVLSKVFPNQDASEVESKLLQAMPHFYED